MWARSILFLARLQYFLMSLWWEILKYIEPNAIKWYKTTEGPIRVVLLSGGLSSYETLRRVVERYGKNNLVVLFADTKIEDTDLYRFLKDIEKSLQVWVNVLQDGRTPIQVFFDVRFFGNSRVDPCSKILKRDLTRSWLKENFPSDERETILYFGISEDEKHRNKSIERNWSEQGYKVEFPLQDGEPYSKGLIASHLAEDGIQPPSLYSYGFIHNNCGGACVKAGQKQWRLLLKEFPDRYKVWEDAETAFSNMIGKDVTMLRRMENGTVSNLSLSQLRREAELGEKITLDEWETYCSCFGVGE